LERRTKDLAFRQLVNAEKTLHFFEELLGGECLTFDTKWYRAVEKEAFSGAHYDNVYMGRGTKQVYTVWTPLMEIPIEMGGLALCLGSQNFEKLKTTYGQSDYEKVSGWFSSDFGEIINKFGGQWATTHFQAGDIIIFGMFMMHGSLTNKTDRYRMSADIRYQLKSEPFDPRWHGKNQVGDVNHLDSEIIEMEEARKEWGV
jgi:ectoine hydroxylase-related dioxygenase (phytanoyl-CoA dioxygenase family)